MVSEGSHQNFTLSTDKIVQGNIDNLFVKLVERVTKKHMYHLFRVLGCYVVCKKEG